MFKQLFWLALLAVGVERVNAFVLLGPFETYQTDALAYRYLGDWGGPHNWGEEYRKNTPVVYYTYDQTFLDYFGSNGVAAVEEAFAIMNSLTNVDYYTKDLSEWPLQVQAFNYKAQALDLTDLKSLFLFRLMEQMGLGMPERYVWALHDREVGPGGCPANVSYLVDKRNFDPSSTPLDQLQPSSYVNGALYSYIIFEGCSTTPVADAVEYIVDPLADSYTSVAGYNNLPGGYFTGLSRDDVAGLRYLMRTNNLNLEFAGTGTLTASTNFGATQLLFTSNLTELVTQALTNSPAALQALYPGLAIVNSTEIYTNLVTTNIFFYLTNYPWLLAGTYMTAFQTNVTTNVTTWYSHVFGNVITNTFYTNGWITVLQTNIGPSPFGSPNVLYTNVKATLQYTNFINGDYYILPTNSDCGVSIINTQLISVLSSTNVPAAPTNSLGTATNSGLQSLVAYQYYFTNRVFVIHPVPCLTNSFERRQGIARVQFIRYDGAYDPILDRYNYPITNVYTLTAMPLTNSTPIQQTVLRPILRPDILISAGDLTTEQSFPTHGGGTFGTTGFGFDDIFRPSPIFTASGYPDVYGPGTIEPTTEFIVNKVGPLFLNFTPFNLDEINQVHVQTWGSFDGSTNNPVVYPNGTSTLNYEAQVFIQVSPVYLPLAYKDAIPGRTNYYTAELGVSSYTPEFTPPVTWSLVPGTPGLPPGLNLTTVGATNAVITGTPSVTGTFDFVVRLTDSQSRTTDRSYFIKVNP